MESRSGPGGRRDGADWPSSGTSKAPSLMPVRVDRQGFKRIRHDGCTNLEV